MNVDWFVLKLVNCLRKICGWSMRQPLRGPPKALAGEVAPKGGEGPSLAPSPLVGALRPGLGKNPGLRGPWHRSKHSQITWNDTFIGVSWDKRLIVTERGLGHPDQASSPEASCAHSRHGPRPPVPMSSQVVIDRINFI